MINDKTDESMEELYKSIVNRYWNNLEKLMKGSDFVFSYVNLLYYKCQQNIRIVVDFYLDLIKSKNSKINAFNTL